MNIVVYRYRYNTYLKDIQKEIKLTKYKKLLAQRDYLSSYIGIFIKRCIVLDETTVQNWFKISHEWTFSISYAFSETTWV